MPGPAGNRLKAVSDFKQLNYSSFGAAVSEVEIDVLTGEKLIVRSDILFDCGRSFNPAVDVGQVLNPPCPSTLANFFCFNWVRLPFNDAGLA